MMVDTVDTRPGQWLLAVKDNIDTRDMKTTAASKFLRQHEPPSDATIVQQLRDRGAVIVGKTNMDEFGMGSHSTNSHFGPVLNPNFPGTARSPGGSSGGSAVAVRLGEALVALGTDTGGSIRLPAAYTGVFGYKPSYGMLSRNGVIKYADSLDTVGLLASSAEVLFHTVFTSKLAWEHDEKDSTSLSPASRARCLGDPDALLQNVHKAVRTSSGANLTIGIPQDYFIEQLDPLIRDAWERAEQALHNWGARIVPVELPSTQSALSAYYVLAPSEAASNLARYDGQRYGTKGLGSYSEIRGEHFGREVQNRVLMGTFSLSSGKMDNYFLKAAKVRGLVRRDFDRVFALPNPLYEVEAFDLSEMPDRVELQDKKGPAQVDFLLCPTAPTFPPRIEDVKKQDPTDSYMNDVFTVPASLAGLPAISVPVQVEGTEETGPVTGLQLIGQAWDDARLLLLAGRLYDLLAQKDR